jgi:hypothetical protein
MRQYQLSHAGASRDDRGLTRRRMSRLARTVDFLIGERCLVHEHVGGPRGLDDGLRGPGVARDHDLPARATRADQHNRIDHASIGERDRLAAVQSPPQRALRDAELAREIGVEAPPSLVLHEREA